MSRQELIDAAEVELAREVEEHPEADVVFPDEAKTSPELRVQIQKNIKVSKEVNQHADQILDLLKKRSSKPPKD